MVYVAFTVWAGALSWIDLRTRRLPNVLTGIGTVAIVCLAVWQNSFAAAFIAGALWAGSQLVFAVISPGSIGGGDIKFSFGLGAFLGLHAPSSLVIAMGSAPALAVLAAIVVRIAGGTASRLPYGPCLALATLGALVFGQQL